LLYLQSIADAGFRENVFWMAERARFRRKIARSSAEEIAVNLGGYRTKSREDFLVSKRLSALPVQESAALLRQGELDFRSKSATFSRKQGLNVQSRTLESYRIQIRCGPGADPVKNS
jgi:hypothetical protein